METATVLFDGECGVCRWFAERLRAWDRDGVLRFTPIQSSEGGRLLRDLPPARRLESWHLVADGHVWSAGAAVPEVLRRLPAGRPLAALARHVPSTTERAYRLVSRHRDRLGRIVRSPACGVDTSPGPSRGGLSRPT